MKKLDVQETIAELLIILFRLSYEKVERNIEPIYL